MTFNEIIFTEKKPQRYVRHVLFWIVLYLPIAGMSIPDLNTMSVKSLNKQFIHLIYLGVDILYTYTVVYYLLPAYFYKKKYAAFGWGLAAASIISFCLSGFFEIALFGYSYSNFWLALWFHTQIFLPAGSFVRCAFFLFVKELKSYYRRTEEKMVLIKENGEAELQLLKAQVHPHFLFNTLNNIYAFTLKGSPVAEQLIAKLSTMLKYMISDCAASEVLLKKELAMLNDYVGLEKVRYGNRLALELAVEGEVENKMIAPLLMIPFVENAFKHGTSKMLESAWIRMNICIRNDSLDFELVNSKPADLAAGNGKSGIGLKNVKKRLELLYPATHKLQIENDVSTFFVKFSVPLHAAS